MTGRAGNYDGYDVIGIIEYFDWIATRDRLRPERNLNISEARACMQMHLDKGIKDVLWSCGRSVVQYHTENEKITRFGAHSEKSSMNSYSTDFFNELEKECPLRTALEYGHKNGMKVSAHLCMNRHYGAASGNCMTSMLARKPEMWETKKDGSSDETRLCFALDEYREERMAIIKEVLELGVDGICLDFVRQPPMLRYHRIIVEEYKKKSGIDPLEINMTIRQTSSTLAEETKKFFDWCFYRSQILTGFMREVRKMLREYELKHNRHVALTVRITDDGFTGNLISGIDIETWCRENMIDEIMTQQLQWVRGLWVHDVAPYVQLGRRTGVKVTGGVNTYPVEGWQLNPVRVAERILEQYNKGVSGISLYETNTTVLQPEMELILDAIHGYESLERLVQNKDWRDMWPVNGFNANCGMDNHSVYCTPLHEL